MFSQNTLDLAEQLLQAARIKGLKFGTAESCTGGLIGALFTEIPGSSDVYECGYITYSNIAKSDALGVPWETIQQFGAVSSQTAAAMANGVIKNSGVDIAVSVTGIAGPGGGSIEKPVGLVYFGMAKKGALTRTFEQKFGEIGRTPVRNASVNFALSLFERALIS